MTTVQSISAPTNPSQSALLVSNEFHELFLKPNLIKGKRLKVYLHKLLSDPNLEYKLSQLKPKKWKKQYQEDGLSLIPLFFYPNECDWARLSLISFGTGFSRCYIFVYLMLLDFGILKLPKNKTKGFYNTKTKVRILCSVILDERERKILRKLQKIHLKQYH